MTQEWIELKPPAPGAIGRLIVWGMGKTLLSIGHVHIKLWQGISKLSLWCANATERYWTKLELVYDALPWAGISQQVLTVEAEPIATEDPEGLVRDLFSAIQGKHVMLVGDTGSGKSTLAQYLAYQVGGSIKVYDADASPEEWSGLEVIGRGGRFEEIGASMINDLDDLEARLRLRGEKGDRALAGMDEVVIAEEFPLLADELGDTAILWLKKHARRGRKPKRFIVALSQDDSVKALRIEGEGAVRKNFRYIRLGKLALEHGKKVLSTSDLAWLKSRDRPCMVDDVPGLLPDIGVYLSLVPRLNPGPQKLPEKRPQTTAQSAFQGLQPEDLGGKKSEEWQIWNRFQQSGLSRSDFIKQELVRMCGDYQSGKQMLEQIELEWGEDQ
jgi:energy-coupling factor transporter ATP-binding protein EcfA2